MKVCAIIPSHNHFTCVGAIAQRLLAAGLYVFIIDDGSQAQAQDELAKLDNRTSGVHVCRLDKNLGKGKAVVVGMRLAWQQGFSHALQVDADGQHDLSVLPAFLDLAARYPEALICGQPLYDASAPIGRRIGRWITHVWVWCETLSFRISDSMCGFRIYPLAAVEALLAQDQIGSHMDFDTDIIVRLFWRGVAPIMRPLRVIYPADNTSNFDLLKDNWRITKMHTRLMLTLLVRLRYILSHRPPHLEGERRWAALSERGVYWGMKFCAVTSRWLGRRGRRVLLAPIILYFYMTGAIQRQASRDFLTRVRQRPPSWGEGYRHFLNFGLRALDVVMAWTGNLPKDVVDQDSLRAPAMLFDDKRGGLIIVSHLGNVEIVRALVAPSVRARLTVLVHTRHAVKYNRIVGEGSPEAAMNIVQVTEIGPETIIDLKQRVEQGGWIVIAGDRVPVTGQGKTVFVPFFGQEAAFPQGPWILASLLGCRVSLLFCILDDTRYHLTMEPFADQVYVPRADRQKAAHDYAARYAQRLEHYAAGAPFQWYNFYDFWSRT